MIVCRSMDINTDVERDEFLDELLDDLDSLRES